MLQSKCTTVNDDFQLILQSHLNSIILGKICTREATKNSKCKKSLGSWIGANPMPAITENT